jgi:mono/diheme cytochrome c family protein
MMLSYHQSNSAVVWGSGGAWSRVLGGLAGLFWLVTAQGAETNVVHEIAIRPIEATAAAKVSYYRDIKPLLANYCVECHGTTGKPDESPAVRYIRGELKPQMPKGNPPLSEEGLHLLREWISAGAKDDTVEAALVAASERAAWEQFDPHQHRTIAKARLTPAEMDALLNDEADGERRFLARRAWRLTQLPPAPIAPPVKGPVFNAVDKFITAKWNENSLPSAAQAPVLCSDEAFVRRAFLDIIGVVPTALEAHQFLTDTNADRRARLIDALLARAEDYADHWATFWEDIIASSDTNIRGGC